MSTEPGAPQPGAGQPEAPQPVAAQPGAPQPVAAQPGAPAVGTVEAAGPDGLALVAEACKKSGLLWLALPGSPQPRPAWHVWSAGAAYVVCGGQEQPLPGLDSAEVVAVTVRSKDRGGRLVTWLAHPVVLPPGAPDWDAAVAELAGKRLNALDPAEQPERWARESSVVRLLPTGKLVERPGSMPTDSGAASPAPTSAVTTGPLPYVLGRGRARRRRRPSAR